MPIVEAALIASASLFVLAVAFCVKYWTGRRPSVLTLALWGLGNAVFTAWDAYVFYLTGTFSVLKLAAESEALSELMRAKESWCLKTACTGALIAAFFWWRFGRALASRARRPKPQDGPDAGS